MLTFRQFLFFLLLSFLCLTAQGAVAGRLEQAFETQLGTLSQMEQVTAIVHMREQPRFTGIPQVVAQRIAHAKAIAARSQRSLLRYLDAEQTTGAVQSFRSIWSPNAVIVTATRAIFETIAKRSDISEIRYNRPLQLRPSLPETTPPPTTGVFAGRSVEPNIALVRADDVWSGFTDTNGDPIEGKGVKVGVVDSGCDTSHADLSSNIIAQKAFDASGNDIGSDVTDRKGHGTHVAGIIAGGNASGKGVGVAPEASLIIAKATDDNGDATDAQVLAGVNWAIEQGAQIINLSLGTEADVKSNTFYTNVNSWTDLGVFVVAAIGNHGPSAQTTASPGNVPRCFGVGAVNNSDEIWVANDESTGSSRGPVTWPTEGEITKPDLVAPGVSVKSTGSLDREGDGGPGSYYRLTGTSQGSPHVSGAIALILQANASISPATLRSSGFSELDPLPDGGESPNNDYGYGRLNCFALVSTFANDSEGPTITHTASTSITFSPTITLTATITDDITATPTAQLFYRQGGTGDFSSVTMSGSGSTYTASISLSGTDELEYYISAADFSSNTSLLPADAPTTTFSSSITSNTSLETSNINQFPNPFQPGQESISITYGLTQDADIQVYIFSLTGELIWKRTFPAGTTGGAIGSNTITWDGMQDKGGIVGNGVYIYQIIGKSARKILGRGKIAALR